MSETPAPRIGPAYSWRLLLPLPRDQGDSRVETTPRGSPHLLDAVQDVLKSKPKDRSRGKTRLQAAWGGYTWCLIRTFEAGCTGVSG